MNRKIKNIVLIAILMIGVATLTGCSAGYKQYDSLFENLTASLGGLKDNDIKSLELLKSQVKSSVDQAEINNMQSDILSRYQNVINGGEDAAKDDLLQSISYLCPINDVKSLMACNIAGEIYGKLNYYNNIIDDNFYSISAADRSPSTGDIYFGWDKELYILEDIGSEGEGDNADLQVEFRTLNYTDEKYYLNDDGGECNEYLDCSVTLNKNDLPSCTVVGDSDIYNMMGTFAYEVTGKSVGINDPAYFSLYRVYEKAFLDLSDKSKDGWSSSGNTKYIIFGVNEVADIYYKEVDGYVDTYEEPRIKYRTSVDYVYYDETKPEEILGHFQVSQDELDVYNRGRSYESEISVSPARTKFDSLKESYSDVGTTENWTYDRYSTYLVDILGYGETIKYEYNPDKDDYWVGIHVRIDGDNALHKIAVTTDTAQQRAIEFWGDNISDKLNEMLKGPILVLKSNFYETGETLASVCDAVNKLKSGTGTTQHQSIVNRTFTYITRDGVETTASDTGQQLDIFEDRDFVITENIPLYAKGHGKDSSAPLELCRIRVKHLNYEQFNNALDIIDGSELSGNLKYWWANADDNTSINNIYLMSYPVKYISDVSVTTTGSGTTKQIVWKTSIKDAKMYINLGAKSISYEDNGKQRLSLGNDLGYMYSFDVDNCSFAAYGQIDGADSSNVVEERRNAIATNNSSVTIKKSPVLIIVDYLEGTYLPAGKYGANTGYDEMYAVLGRKLRLQKVGGGSGDDVMAYVVGKAGTVIGGDNPVKIKMTDLASIKQIDESSKYPIEKLSFEMYQYSSGVKTTYFDAMTGADTDASGMIIDSNKAGKKYGSSIKIGLFGKNSASSSTATNGQLLGKVDADNADVNIPNLFVIGTDYSIVNSQLVTGWINIEDTGNGNMPWWNSWLQSNNYRYSVITSEIEDALYKTYKFEMAKEGYIILDLPTIAKIQEIYDHEALEDEASWIRTFSFIVGLVMIAYSLLLLGAWVIDVNLGGGYKILGKLTFGKLIAATSDTAGLETEEDKITYMTFGSLLVRVGIMVGIGILLTAFDIVDLFYSLLNAIDGIISAIKKFIFNL